MNALSLMGLILVFAGVLFFLAGSIGLVRFPGLHSRLHALTKADNVGLGLLSAGVCLISPDGFTAVKLAAIWLLVMTASAASSLLIAGMARNRGLGNRGPEDD